MIVNAYYDEPVGNKTVILDEYDHCTKSERPDSFHAVLTDEQPKATFIPKNTGITEFKIHTNESGCEIKNFCTIFAMKDPNQSSSNDNNGNNNNNNNVYRLEKKHYKSDGHNNDNNNNNNNNNKNNDNNNKNSNKNNNTNTTITVVNSTGVVIVKSVSNNVQIPAFFNYCILIVFTIICAVMSHFIP
ncbi:hypothetical protein RclHR1_03740015 [Rhizophagus clarus]|uniref:Uncharacterized protein n=1 Tax=Rhizophagus clarus TaxID=94130 RepID=A0A2Z6RDT8_9GLOM|nr:hypothetical protein RclHR1_03740015 [Rhizophagus clarus]